MTFVPKASLAVSLFLSFSLEAMVTGNPGEPLLQPIGVVITPPAYCSLRIGYLDDYVYQQRFQELDILTQEPPPTSAVEMYTHCALVTLNFHNRLDLYTLLGSSRLLLDQEVFTRSNFAWGIGAKIVIFKYRGLVMGADVKYFQTNYGYINYLVSDGTPYKVIGPFTLKYDETQVMAGFCYKTKLIVPYINVTYLSSHIDPDPGIILVSLSPSDLVDSSISSITSQRKWGMAIGATIISSEKATLSVESRMFNQNAIDVNLEIRF